MQLKWKLIGQHPINWKQGLENVEKKIKAREESASSSKTKDGEHKIDEITSLIRNLSNIISIMEAQPRVTEQVANRSQVQYISNFQPQIL